MHRRSRLTGALVPLALLAAAACQQGPTPAQQQQLARLDTVSAERDRLLQEVSTNARTISEIAVQLSKVQVPARQLRTTSESPLDAQRDTMIQKIRYIAARVSESERSLADSRRKVRDLTTISDSLRATLDTTITNFQMVVSTQRAAIDSLTAQMTVLVAENTALKDTVNNMTTRENTVFYVIGTKQELIDKGIVVEEGGSRVLFVLWRTGRTLAPARVLNPQDFTAINKREMTQIPLPDPAAHYRLASRQDPSYLGTPPDQDGWITGANALQVTAPEQFWATSKFLIIVKSE